MAKTWTLDVVVTSDDANRMWNKADEICEAVRQTVESAGTALQKPFMRDMHWSFHDKMDAEIALAAVKRVKTSKWIEIEASINPYHDSRRTS